ncbi:MAG: hypothetical protein K6E24_01850 [bacterium]|nr:hypothetical protein [bacterium]
MVEEVARMDLKKTVLDHIIYEFQMYLYTYKRIIYSKMVISWTDQLDNNCYWISHCNSMRNILRFFMSNNGDNTDDYQYSRFGYSDNKSVLDEYNMEETDLECVNKKMFIIDKAVCHLTERRFYFKDDTE